MKIAGIVGLVLALLLAVFLGWYVLRLARRRALGTPSGTAPKSDDGPLAAAAGLAPAVRAAFAGREEEGAPAYNAPLVLLAGEPGSGKSSLLQDADAHDQNASSPLRWHELPQGWVLAADTAYLGLDDQDGAEAWQALADELQRRRPRRPLDGILLTIGADSLVGPNAWPPIELERRAALAQRRLGEMQALFGLRLPVYLLITRCDQLEGFSSFASALPDGLRQAMLGWSNPNDLEAVFGPEWIVQGFQELSRTISSLQAEMCAAGAHIEDSDAFFMLPGAIDRIGAPARAYAARLFADNAHSTAPMFRGLYLCGDPSAATDPLPARPWFAGDLLARKVFPERGVARPLGGQILSRNKLVRRWAIACAVVLLLWGGALTWAHYDLKPKAKSLADTVDKINMEQEERAAKRAKIGHLDYGWYKESAQGLMDAMVNNGGDLSYIAIPASWRWTKLQHVEEDVEARFGQGLANIVYRTLDKGLNLQAVALTGAVNDSMTTDLSETHPCLVLPAPETDALTPNTSLADSAPFKRLAGFVADAGEFEQARKRLDRLQSLHQGVYDDLIKVAAYTDAFDLPQQPKDGVSAVLKAALHNANKPEDAEVHRKTQAASVECAFRQQSMQFYARALDNNPALASARSIAEQLRGGQALGQHRQLIPSLQNMGLWLKSPSLRWLDEAVTGEGKPYGEVLQKASANSLIGQELVQWAKKERDDRADSLELAMLSAEGGQGNAILQKGAEGNLEFTPELANLKSGLDRLARQPFMAPVSPVAPIPPSIAGPLWDVKTLNGDLVLADEARAYLDKELRTFPVQFQAELKRYTSQRVADNLAVAVTKAQMQSPNEAEVYERLGQVQKQLTSLLDTLHNLDIEQQYASVNEMVAAQASNGLRWLERDLTQNGLYRPRDGNFGWWQGTPNPAAQGFAGGDPAGLEEYLAAQQARIEAAVRHAQPLLKLVEAGEGGLRSPSAKRWTDITAELARYQEKQPNARMAQLHAYIRGDLAATDGKKCAVNAIPAAVPVTVAFGASDFFTERRRALATALAVRCRELAGEETGKGYMDLRAQFRRSLAGRFPFADAAGAADSAELDDVLSYLRLYDQAGFDLPRLRPGSERDFIAASGAARAFLAPLLPTADGSDGTGYDLAVRFRVGSNGESDGNNALGGEIGGNHIVAWTLQSGDERISWTSSSKSAVQMLPWRPGMQVVLTLRWADNVTSLPFSDGSDRYMSVTGRDVIYRYSEPWSLLRMLARQRVPRMGPAKFETLRFDIPTAPTSAAAKAAMPNDERARVFLSMTVMPSQKKEALVFPRFPIAAPGDEQNILMARP
ncbi:type VI secretion system protein [Pseudoduganella sp. RAF19]|uniref:type VI secretion system protein n=3 Tax=unclassified Pseudoduganella TaxID=2637179 RepID=UPI003F9AEA6F